MKPATFAYERPNSVQAVLALLAEHGSHARLLAGGQSLAPMLNMRLAQPERLIDLNDLEELALIRECDDRLEIGALARHRDIEHSTLVQRRCPFLSQVARTIGHYAIRQRGTIGGSLAQADPAAQFVLAIVLLDAQLELVRTARARWVRAQDFITGPMTTCIEPDELLTRIHFPTQSEGERSAYQALAQRHGDYALVAAGVTLRIQDRRLTELRIALSGAADSPLRMTDIEATFEGLACTPEAPRQIAARCQQAVSPADSDGIDGEYRRALVGVLVERALEQAIGSSAECAA